MPNGNNQDDNVDPKMVGVGGALGGVTDISIQWPFEQNKDLQGTFPYIQLPGPLPPADDAIVGLGGLGLWGLGKSLGNSDLRDIGLGHTAYGVGLFARNTTLRLLRNNQGQQQ